MKIIWESGWAETHYDRFEHSGWVHSEHREARILIGQNSEGFHLGLEEKHQGEFYAQRWDVPRKSMEETKENGRQHLNEWLKENGMKPLQDGLIEPWKSEEEQEWSRLRREKVEQAFSASAQKISDGTKRSPAEKYGASPERKEAQSKSIPYIKLVKG